jgi:hypothetical protein
LTLAVTAIAVMVLVVVVALLVAPVLHHLVVALATTLRERMIVVTVTGIGTMIAIVGIPETALGAQTLGMRFPRPLNRVNKSSY